MGSFSETKWIQILLRKLSPVFLSFGGLFAPPPWLLVGRAKRQLTFQTTNFPHVFVISAFCLLMLLFSLQGCDLASLVSSAQQISHDKITTFHQVCYFTTMQAATR